MAVNTSWSNDTDAINTVLAEEANRIGSDVHKRILHTSPWIDLIKKRSFPDGMGYQLTSLVYDRSVPTYDDEGSNLATHNTWKALGVNGGSNDFGTSQVQGNQGIAGAMETQNRFLAGDSTGATDGMGFISVSKVLHTYSLKRLSLESPVISLEDLRFAAHRTEQLRAIVDLLSQASRHSWEERYRMEFDRLAGNIVPCLTSGTKIYDTIDISDSTKKSGTNTDAVDFNNDFDSTGVDADKTPTANISNAILDKIYYNLVRKGGGADAYGRENGRPVFGLVCSSEASYQLQTEAGFRDDVRYNKSAVSDLIAPLGIEKAFRGFYHLIDDLAPRFNSSGDVNLDLVSPYSQSAGVTTMNSDYDTATFEAAYVIHPEVFESLIPAPFSAGAGVDFDAASFAGEFKWTNIKSVDKNPDGHNGFFRGLLASASKPIKTDFGYVIVFKRDSTTPAA